MIYKKALSNYFFKHVFKLNYRASFFEFWLGCALQLILICSSGFFFYLLALLFVYVESNLSFEVNEIVDMLIFIVVMPSSLLFYFFNLLIFLSAIIRRLHDLNLRMYFMLLILLPYVGILILFALCLMPKRDHNNRYVSAAVDGEKALLTKRMSSYNQGFEDGYKQGLYDLHLKQQA